MNEQEAAEYERAISECEIAAREAPERQHLYEIGWQTSPVFAEDLL